jgi:hypothetical protein
LLAALTFATLMKCCFPWMAAAPKTKSVVKDWTFFVPVYVCVCVCV